MLIRDVVTQNDQAEFANDVQLSWYPNDSRNLPLVRGYMFTEKAVDKKVPSVQVLRTIRDSFLWQTGGSGNNRLVVIATYGHGKSHLALVLANFFGKAPKSPEVDAILRRVSFVTNEGEAQGFRDYKDNRPPHLIVRLRGDQPASLPQQFISALETAIEEHPNTKGTSLPFWFEEALRVFSILKPDQQERAEAVLQEYNTDLASLVARIQERDATAYELCMKAATAALLVSPNLGGEVSLEKALTWAANEFCTGDTRKAGGILILFDEFSLFVQRYSNRLTQADAPLQDLLNGVENAKKKVVFVAFSQHDPNTVAREIYKSGGDRLDSLLKELERLPVTQHLYLHSSLEMVLNAYLKQTTMFDEVREQYPSHFVRASSATRSLMGRIYTDANGWDTELFDKTVTYGCFPLHPLTASLFSSVEFKQVINGRSMIGFVLETLKNRLNDDVVVKNKPNWVHPIELVDWFQEMLNEERYREYRYASEAAFLGITPDPIQEAVLKGMLLFIVGRMEIGRIGTNYEQAISHLTGYKPEECSEALGTLNDGGYIRFDESKKVYAFWAANSGATKIQSMLETELKNRTFGSAELSQLNKEGGEWLTPQDVSGITWGAPEDWQAKEQFLTRTFFTVEKLKQLLPRSGFIQGQLSLVLNRGCIVRLIALSEEDIAYFHEKAGEFLKEALGNSAVPPPILITIPSEPLPHFCTNFLRYDQLSAWSSEQRKEVSIEAYTQRLRDIKGEVSEAIRQSRESSDVIVPQAYVHDIQASGAAHSPNRAMQVLYARAYIHAARPYFTQHSMNGTNHKKAVDLLCKSLVRDTIQSDHALINTNKVAEGLLTKILKPHGSSSWGIVGFTDHVQAPAAQQIRAAWETMDKAFVAGNQSVPVKNVLIRLLNPPYGYDPHQIALLFCAWYGLNRRNVRLLKSGGDGATTLSQYCDEAKSPLHLIELLCAIDPPMLERTDPNALENELRIAISRVSEEKLTLAEAKAFCKQLQIHAKNPDLDLTLTKQVQSTAEALEKEIDAAQKYHQEEEALTDQLRDGTLLTIEKTVQILKQIQSLPNLGRINEPDWKTTTALRQETLKKMATCLERDCRKLEQFSSLADYGSNKTRLESLERQLKPVGDLTLNNRISDAFGRLQQVREELDRKDKDRNLLAQIHAMQETAPLHDLEINLSHLEAMKPHSQSTAEIIEKKVQALKKSLEDGKSSLAELIKRREQALDLPQAESLYEGLLKQSSRFASSTLERAYNSAVAECKALITYFTGLKQVAETDPQTPPDVDELKSRLDLIVTEATSLLSEEQREQSLRSLDTVEAKASCKRQKALEWLTTCETNISQGKELDEIETRLMRVPPFLPEEENERLAQARYNLKKRLYAEEAEREAKRQDAPMAGQLQALPVHGSLPQLRVTLQQLEALAPILPKTKELKDTRRTQIQKAIDQHLARLEEFEKEAKAASALSQIKALEQSVQRAFTQFEGSEESQRLSLLLQTVQQLRAEKEKQESNQAHDALITTTVQKMNIKESLASLRTYQEQLTTYTPKLPATQQTIVAKSNEVAAAIEVMLTKLAVWQDSITQATTVLQLLEIEKAGFGMQSRYAETPESRTLETALQQSSILRSVLEEKERIEQTRPSSPDDYNSLTQQLAELKEHHAALLSPVQGQAFSQAQETLDGYVHQKSAEAEEWLRQREKELEAQANAYELQNQLASPHPFLPISCLPTLDTLKANNQKRIDEDVIGQIVDRFRRIADLEKQKRCLDLLQQALTEQYSP